MAVALVVGLAILASKHVKAAAVSTPFSNPRCVELTLPISVVANASIYDTVHVNSNRDAAACGLDLAVPSQRNVTDRIIRNITISDTYSISGKLCVPAKGAKKDILQIATHGGGFDGRYWDIRINPSEYSYVDNTLGAGYSIFTYDRIGTGGSSKPDAYTVVQLPLEVEILRGITELARAGKLLDYANDKTHAPPQSFTKIVHVGHSLGSVVTLGLVAHYGALSDGTVATGIIPYPVGSSSPYTAFSFGFPPEVNPKKFKDWSSGYLISTTPSAVQTCFLSTLRNETSGIGGFKNELLDYSWDIAQPITAGELVSVPQVNIEPSQDFDGPIQFFLAEFDYLECGGDCRGIEDKAALETLYPHASDIDFYIQEGNGHGLTFHRGANIGYKVTYDWLAKNGL